MPVYTRLGSQQVKIVRDVAIASATRLSPTPCRFSVALVEVIPSLDGALRLAIRASPRMCALHNVGSDFSVSGQQAIAGHRRFLKLTTIASEIALKGDVN